MHSAKSVHHHDVVRARKYFAVWQHNVRFPIWARRRVRSSPPCANPQVDVEAGRGVSITAVHCDACVCVDSSLLLENKGKENKKRSWTRLFVSQRGGAACFFQHRIKGVIRFSATVPFLTNTEMSIVKFQIENKAPTQKARKMKARKDGNVFLARPPFLTNSDWE